MVTERVGSGQRIPALDGIRGIAILLVLTMHSYGVGVVAAPENLFFRLAHAGWLGVDLFFVLSGFLITSILIRTRGQANYYRNFYARRTLRIFPPYYVVLMGLVVLGLFLSKTNAEMVQSFISTLKWLLTFTTNIAFLLKSNLLGFGFPAPNGSFFNTSHFWSLAVEEQFYWVWPLLVAAVPPRRLPWATAAICLGAFALRLHLVDAGRVLVAYTFTLARADTLAIGALVAIADARGKLGILRLPAVLVLPLGVALIVAYILAHGTFDAIDPQVAIWGYPLAGLLFASLLIIVLDRPEGLLSRLCSIRLLRAMGKYSYSVYLVHLILVNPLLITAIYRPEVAISKAGSLFAWLSFAFTLSVGGSFLIAMVFWHGFERRILEFKRCFPYARQPNCGPDPVPALPAAPPDAAPYPGHRSEDRRD